jgi:hypothetical protein
MMDDVFLFLCFVSNDKQLFCSERRSLDEIQAFHSSVSEIQCEDAHCGEI